MTIGQRPLASFTIANNLLTPSNKATKLGISPQITIMVWNNFKNLEDGFSGMKHFKKCSYTILESPPENKWGVVAKAWVNKDLFRTKMCSG
jgi:hypothetical protein